MYYIYIIIYFLFYVDPQKFPPPLPPINLDSERDVVNRSADPGAGQVLVSVDRRKVTRFNALRFTRSIETLYRFRVLYVRCTRAPRIGFPIELQPIPIDDVVYLFELIRPKGYG
jgi:hypothetical protein